MFADGHAAGDAADVRMGSVNAAVDDGDADAFSCETCEGFRGSHEGMIHDERGCRPGRTGNPG
jgi:hypothetical protein